MSKKWDTAHREERNRWAREWRTRHPERVAAYVEAHREQARVRSRIYAASHRLERQARRTLNYTRYRAKAVERQYHITQAQYDMFWELQDGLCRGGCGRQPTDIDHDHWCCPGKGSCGFCVRGLLCHHCNTVLARTDDNPDILRALADYLDKN